MEDQNQNNLNTTVNNDLGIVKGAASASPSLDSSKLELAEEYLNNWKRERADFVNYKKDEAQRMGEFVKFGNESLILELVETLDDLYLAAKEVKNSGLDQVIKKFEDLLKKYGLEKIDVGDKFDPMLHEVVEMSEGEPVKSPDGDNWASKIEEVRAGYTMHGKVVRPIRVRIIK